MWLKLVLCVIVGLACADDNPGWRHNHEYVYEVRGRTLASLNQISSNYTGILIKGKLFVRPTSEGHLGAKVTDVYYADIHSNLQHGWEQQIPDSELNYQRLALTSDPFKITLDDGVVRQLGFPSTVTNWETNVIKGIVSQLQLDTQAENVIDSYINILTLNSNNAVYKTMEKTVQGEVETLYDIHPLPEYILQTTPWLVPLRDMEGSNKLIEIIKNKNFTHSKERPSYNFGFDGVHSFDINNNIADSFSRSAVSRAVISGTLDDFTLQSSVTTDEITMNPTRDDKQRGSTNTIVNITLSSLKPVKDEFPVPSDSIYVDLVYSYNTPFDEDNGPVFSTSYKNKPSAESSEENELNPEGNGASDENSEEYYSFVQEKPHMDEPPASPLLPLTVGYNGEAINSVANVRENAIRLCRLIGQEWQQPESVPEKNTVGKFSLLTSLVKVMNYKEMQAVSIKLYTEENEGAAAAAWFAYRDAIAQGGTGPALLLIRDWIGAKKISEEEAAEVVAAAADSARTPTEKYMKFFFKMIENNDFMEQPSLNESLLLSYTSLVYHVYVNKEDSHSRYPVHSFGPFRTLEGRRFVINQVIPHLSQKLHEAVNNADTVKIHAYIRALGNVGHPQVLKAFKAYFEGTKKASQFQRILMVVALDKLVISYPKVACSVLFKIIQNRHDFEQVRVAALYQLIRTKPAPEILQRIAAFTNVDTNNHVNAAIKSIIESAAKFENSKYASLRAAAISAKPLLSAQDFGMQYSNGHLTSYVVEHMQLEYNQGIETFGGEDSVYPKGISYYLEGGFGGLRQRVVNWQSMVSSIEDLINVFEQQTSTYRRLLEQKQAEQSVQEKFSSDYTAKMLNMQNEQREQLEGYLYLQMQSLQKILSFDNHTIERLNKAVLDWEQKLKNGFQHRYNNMVIYPQSAIAFPTAWGLPFIYTYDRLAFTQFKSDVKASSNPTVSSENGLRRPSAVEAELQLGGFFSGRSQSQFGFFTPFNQKRYSAGYDKNFQVIVPKTSAKIHADVDNSQITIELQNDDNRRNLNLLHFSSWPYTALHHIYTPQPQTQVISSETPQRINLLVGQQSTGIALSVEVRSDEILDYGFLYDKLSQEDLPSALLSPWLNDNVQHIEINVGIDSARSSTNKMTIHLGRQQKFSSGLNSHNDAHKPTSSNNIAQQSLERQKQFLGIVSKDIFNVQAQSYDVVADFEGAKPLSYAVSLAGARSDIDPKGRVLVQFLKDSKPDKPFKVIFKSNIVVPNTNELNAIKAIEFDPNITAEIEGYVDRGEESPQQIMARVQFTKSQARKEYLKQKLLYKRCQKEMQGGNNQLPACAILTAKANLLDQFSFNMDYQNISDAWINATYRLYSALRERWYPRFSENLLFHMGGDLGKPHLNVGAQFSPDLSRLNASIESVYGFAEIRNVEVDDFGRNVLVAHPVYHLMSRLHGYALKCDTYKPICVVDKNQVNTFDNKTYPLGSLGSEWVVMLQYAPRRPSSIPNKPVLSVVEQLNQQIEGYITYVRASENNPAQKEFKMVIQSPKTLATVIDITLKPSSSSSSKYPRLFIQGEEIIYDNEGTHIYDHYMQVYKLPNNELKVEVYDWFTVAFDGERVKMTLFNDKYRDAGRGLCGTFTEEEETDFTNPKNCIVKAPEEMIKQYSVSSSRRGKFILTTPTHLEDGGKCYRKFVDYVKIVSFKDLNPDGPSKERPNVQLQTRYVTNGDQTCFSIEPVPVCKKGFKQDESHRRSVPVHCLKTSSISKMYTSQIDQGASPSFKSKAVSMNLPMSVAQTCSE